MFNFDESAINYVVSYVHASSTGATYSGLRGAMAFALALQSVHDLPVGHGETIFTATTSIVVLTVSRWM